MLDRAGRRLDRGRRQRRLAADREDHAVDSGRLGAAQERPDVLRILERVEDEDERRLATLDGPREDVVKRGEPARLDDERDALVPVEAGERGQRSALELDDRDAQPRGVEHQLLQRSATLRDDQQAKRGTTGGERLLDGPPAGDELLVGSEAVGRRKGRRPAWLPAGRPAGAVVHGRTERWPVATGRAARRLADPAGFGLAAGGRRAARSRVPLGGRRTTLPLGRRAGRSTGRARAPAAVRSSSRGHPGRTGVDRVDSVAASSDGGPRRPPRNPGRPPRPGPTNDPRRTTAGRTPRSSRRGAVVVGARHPGLPGSVGPAAGADRPGGPGRYRRAAGSSGRSGRSAASVAVLCPGRVPAGRPPWPGARRGRSTATRRSRTRPAVVVAPRPVSHGSPRPDVASAGRPACPRRRSRAPRARRGVDRRPPSRAPRARPPAGVEQRLRRPGRGRGPRRAGSRAPRQGRAGASRARSASALDSARRSIRRFSSRTRSNTAASAADTFRSSSSAAPNASRADARASGRVGSSGRSSR